MTKGGKVNRDKVKEGLDTKNIGDDDYENVELSNKSRSKREKEKVKELENKKQIKLNRLKAQLEEAEEEGYDQNALKIEIDELTKKELSRGELKNVLDNDLRGVKLYVHPKPYPDYAWPWESSRNNNYISKINYEVIGRDNPYARVDENLRQLKAYTLNDVMPYYNVSLDREGMSIRAQKNLEKKNPNRFNQYLSKEIIIYPNSKMQKHGTDLSKAIGGRKKKRNRKTKNKKRGRRNKTKRNKKI